MPLRLTKPNHPLKGNIKLPASKSICNRALIIRYLAREEVLLDNMSDAKDTLILKHELESKRSTKDAGDAGTAYRFLTALLASTPGEWELQGSGRMNYRPIGALVDALRKLGAEINYLGEEGYPPLSISGRELEGGEVSVMGDISSQYISALMLIAPTLKRGLRIKISGDVVASRSYLNMTAGLLEHFSVPVQMSDRVIGIQHTDYQARQLYIEGDWSAASYLYALAALLPGSELLLSDLYEESLQGDAMLWEQMEKFGVQSRFDHYGAHVRSTETDWPEHPKFKLLSHPDLAQTLACMCAAKGIEASFYGLDNLRIKETDRIVALDTELQKVGYRFNKQGEAYELQRVNEFPKGEIAFRTYNDHRMAMALSILALRTDTILLDDESVVDKSFPAYWEQLTKLGFRLEHL